MGNFKKLLIPHHSNNYHPYSTRYYTLIGFSLLLILLNFFVFPALGIESGKVLASNYDLDQLVTLSNKERKASGLIDLKRNDELNRAALAKGNDMLKKQYWAHFGPDGETPWQFIIYSGYDYIYAGENLAKDFSKPLETHLAWMKSTTHKANILNANFRDLGLAKVNGKFNGKETTIIIQMFGSKTGANVGSTSQLEVKSNLNPDISTYTPSIVSPLTNSILNTSKIVLNGEAEIGDTLKVYSNQKLIGELPKNNNPFTINIDLLELENNLSIKSKENLTGKESQESNFVNILIDRTPPDLEKSSIQYLQNKEGILIEIQSEEKLSNIDIQTDYELNSFIEQNSQYYYLIKDNVVKQFTLLFYDEAGNVSTKEVNLELEQKDEIPSLPEISGILTEKAPWYENISLRLGQKELINLFVITFMFVLIILDLSYLIKNGIKREFHSHHGFHLGLILICFVGVFSL